MACGRGFAEESSMDRLQMQAALLKITLVVLVGTSWLFVGFLFDSRPEVKTMDALTTLVRLPASLPSSLPENVFSASRPVDPIRMDVFELPCWDKTSSQPQSVSSRWIRLRGIPCEADKNTAKIFVKNLSNGYEATVFSSKGDALTTDFIPLQEGKNQIEIKVEGAPGAIVENRFEFNRN